MLCTCRCHVPYNSRSPYPSSGVDCSDVIEATVACPACEHRHCEALLNVQLPSDGPGVPPRGVQVITPEGRTMSWAEYQRELENRADSWRHVEGEGAE